LRPTGIDVIGSVPWGTHFCQFFEGRQDLLDILVPYFVAGLQQNEACLWITSEPLRVDEAKAALTAAVGDLDPYFENGQLEILDYTQWYAREGEFDAQRVMQGWADKLAAAQQRGFHGLRLTGNTFWLQRSQWRDLTEYEAAINRAIVGRPMLALCTYCLAKCGAAEILDVMANHAFALIRRAGVWQVVENAEFRRAEAELRASNEQLRLAHQELQKARDELELRVRARTAELEQAAARLEEEIRERIRTEAALRLEEARLEALLRLSHMGEVPLPELAAFTLEQAIRLTQSAIGFIGFLNEDESVCTLHAVSKELVKECPVSGEPRQWRVASAGRWADAIRERRTLFVNDYSKPHPGKKGPFPGHSHVDRFMVVPLQDGDRIVAIAALGNKASHYDSSDERQVSLLLSGMWSCVQRSLAREALQKAYAELETKVQQRTAELAATADALRHSRDDLNRAQALAHVGSWRLDVRRNVLEWSDEAYRIFGVPPGTPLTYDAFLARVHPDDRDYVDRKWSAAMRGEPYDIEHRIIVGDAVKWVRERAEIEVDDQGRPLGGFGTVQDRTERRRAEEEQARLRRELVRAERERAEIAERMTTEINHRMKNNLVLLSSILQMQMASLPPDSPAVDAIRQAISRISAISAVHEQLYREQPGAVELRDLLRRVGEISAQALTTGEAAISASGGPCYVSAKLGTTVAMLANELITNAVKYGAPGDDGKLAVQINVAGGEHDLTVTVWNSGNPLPDDFDLERHSGLGLSLVRSVIAQQLEGSFHIQPHAGGTLARIVLPGPALRASFAAAEHAARIWDE
jgi:two-component sensor histidine kinase/PAS domain-containing protein